MSNVIYNNNLKIAVALGSVSGWRLFRKFGMNPDVDSGTEELWPPGTPRVLPSAAAAASVVGGANDVATSGTGAWTLRVEGLAANYNEVGETISMTGATPALTTQTFLRVSRAYVVTAGTTGGNVGAISISVGGDLQAYIEALQGQTHQTHYTVPAGYTLLVTSFHITGGRMGNTDMQVWSQVKLFGDDTAWRTLDDTFMYENNFVNEADVFVIPEKTEIRQRIVCTTTNGEVGCTWSGFLIKGTAPSTEAYQS